MALSKADAPGRAVTGFPPASVSQGRAMPASGTGPVPISPFSDWKKTWIPRGTKLATSVGIPMPRLTSIPSRSSRAIRLAMTVCASILSLRDEVVDNRRGGHNVVRRYDADGDHVFRLNEDRVCGHRHHRIEIAGGEGVAEVAEVVGDKRMHEREVGAQSRLQQVIPSV